MATKCKRSRFAVDFSVGGTFYWLFHLIVRFSLTFVQYSFTTPRILLLNLSNFNLEVIWGRWHYNLSSYCVNKFEIVKRKHFALVPEHV